MTGQKKNKRPEDPESEFKEVYKAWGSAEAEVMESPACSKDWWSNLFILLRWTAWERSKYSFPKKIMLLRKNFSNPTKQISLQISLQV
jgi:hypothetical protein